MKLSFHQNSSIPTSGRKAYLSTLPILTSVFRTKHKRYWAIIVQINQAMLAGIYTLFFKHFAQNDGANGEDAFLVLKKRKNKPRQMPKGKLVLVFS